MTSAIAIVTRTIATRWSGCSASLRRRSKPSLKTAISWKPNSACTPGSTMRASSSVCCSASLSDSPASRRRAPSAPCTPAPLIARRRSGAGRARRAGSPPPRRAAPAAEAAALVRVVDDEEVLDLREHLGRDVAQLAALAVAMRRARRRRAGDRCARRARLRPAARPRSRRRAGTARPSRRHRLVGEDEDVERIAVVAERRRQEAEVVREREAERQHAREDERPPLGAGT